MDQKARELEAARLRSRKRRAEVLGKDFRRPDERAPADARFVEVGTIW